GEIIEVGTANGSGTALQGRPNKSGHSETALESRPTQSLNDGDKPHPLQAGDVVAKGQLLAVLWSKDLGEKKSELIDALSQLRLDRETHQRLQDLYQKEGAIPPARVDEARRAVEASLVAAGKAERTLRAWRISDEEIAALHAEAKRLGQPGAK